MDMRKLIPLLLTALLAAMPLLNSCRQAQLGKAEQQYDPGYTIGIIKTTEYEYSSYIEYYNQDLELVNAIRYPYAGLIPDSGAPAAQRDGKLYLIPRGLMTKQDDRKVISLDLKSGDIREYAVDLVAISGLAVDERYIYASNNLNAVGNIARVDIESGDVTYLELGSIAGKLFIHNKQLYASWTDLGTTGFSNMEDDAHFLSSLDQNLNLLQTIDITSSSFGSLGCVSEPAGDSQYMAFFSKPDPESNSFDCDIYSCASLEDGLDILCRSAHEPSCLLPYKETLITTNTDAATDKINFIDIYDRHDGTLLYSLSLDYRPRQAVIDGDVLYVQGFDCLVKYSINGNTVAEQKRIGIPRIGSPTDADFHYLSGIFLNK
jgi:hypothetical protein